MPIQTAIKSVAGPRTGRLRSGLSIATVVLAWLLMSAPGTIAAVHASGFRVARTCGVPAPGRAACLAMRLLPDSLSATEQAANRAAYRRAAERHQRLAVAQETPIRGFLTPELLHAAYALPTETAAAATQTIAVVDAFDDPTAESDLAVYDKQFGLAECTTANGCFKKINQNGNAGPLPAANGEWAGEISIDVQMVRAICQNCKILLVEANSEQFSDLGAGVSAAVAAGATVISNSYGGPELGSYASVGNADYNHPGRVLTASSGDCGYLNETCNGFAKKANFPASFQDVVAIGGTSLIKSKRAWVSSVWSGAGSGCSGVFSAPLWQAAVANFSATGCGGGRAVADVAAVGDPNTGVDIYDSTPERVGGPTGWGVWGGTSVSSPVIAAEWGLAGGAHGVEYAAATLYGHSGQASNLYDVVTGHTGSCGSSTICTAAVGFDGPTGVGSPAGLGAFAVVDTPVNTAPPTITGAAAEGSTLSADPGEWSSEPTSYAYQWERCKPGCSPIAPATGASYTLVAADVGARIRVLVKASNENGAGTPAVSAQTATVTSDAPSISSFTPSAITGAAITIEGTGLDSAAQLLLGKAAMSFSVVSPGKLQATVPNGAKSGKLVVTTEHGSAKGKGKLVVTFSVQSFKPISGAAGTAVTIKGVGFNSSSVVRFAGVQASVTSFAATKLKVLVPSGAGGGPITVTNSSAPTGTVSSATSYTP